MMQIPKSYLLTSVNQPERKGIVYTYSGTSGLLTGIEIRDDYSLKATQWVIANVKLTQEEFIEWVKENKSISMVPLDIEVTFEMMWDKYNDKKRSSKKKSMVIWVKMKKEDQIMAYYFHDEYDKNRGSAEKKYLETYLRAELWNN